MFSLATGRTGLIGVRTCMAGSPLPWRLGVMSNLSRANVHSASTSSRKEINMARPASQSAMISLGPEKHSFRLPRFAQRSFSSQIIRAAKAFHSAAPTRTSGALDASSFDEGKMQDAVKTKENETVTETTRPLVAYHLFFCAALVYLIIVVGGLTRLTESGLSITEWNPGLKGMRLPWTAEEWEEEWQKYQRTPEWMILNRHMTLDDFKTIYMWEWSHRILGRVIGMAFLLPTIYFLARRQVARGTRWKLMTIAAGIGFQGALGWFMVKSGLAAPKDSAPAIEAQHPNTTVSSGTYDMRLDAGRVSSQAEGPSTSAEWHPRVSHFRLAAHLGTAFAVYLGMVHTGMAILRDHKLVTGKGNAGGWAMAAKENLSKIVTSLNDPRINRFRSVSRAMLGLTFVTAMTGALVAGLDAGLVYSEFPYMGDGLVPPRDELLDEKYTWRTGEKEDNADAKLVLGNATQNPVTVQLIHRCLAISTLASALGLGLYARRMSHLMTAASRASSLAKAAACPPAIPRLAALVSLTAAMQASLGISTLIYLVPIELASAHQAGSVALLNSIVALLAALRRPNSRILRLLRDRQRLSLQGASQDAAIQRQAIVARALDKVAR